MVDVSDSETRKCGVHVSECVTRKCRVHVSECVTRKYKGTCLGMRYIEGGQVGLSTYLGKKFLSYKPTYRCNN